MRERHSFNEAWKRSKPTHWWPGTVWDVSVEYSDGFELELPCSGKKPKLTRERGATGWRPSIHMPRWASRITLEVVSVRVERLQEISETDALAEGINGEELFRAQGYAPDAFRKLWDSLNAKRGYGWAKNPYVWVIEFKRL